MTKSEIKPAHIAKFCKLAKDMNKLMLEICSYNQEANIYIEDSGNVNLMKGPSHGDQHRNPKALREIVVAYEQIYSISGGGW